MSNRPNSRKLKRNENVIIPEYFMFVDTETLLKDNDKGERIHEFRLGVAIFLRLRKDGFKPNRDVLKFTDIKDFWCFVDDNLTGNNTLNIIAHNALFDMTILEWLTELTKLGFGCKFVFEQGLTFISKWRNEKRGIVILDNANWFPGKLSVWGDTLGLPKMAMPEFEEDNSVWFPYCMRDVEILESLQEWLIAFIRDNDLGSWKYTRASVAFNAYRHKFMFHPIYVPEQTRETYLARQAYKGGRTEVFRVGNYQNDTYYKLDINSMYPSVMAHNKYPVAVEGYARKPTIKRLENILNRHLVVGHFRVNVTQPYFPYTLNKKTVYPIGEFDTFLYTPDVRIALNNGWIVKCYELAYYRQREIFTEFVEYFYAQRLLATQNGNYLLSKLFKLLLNSLYGKFGQRNYDDKIIGKAQPGTFKTSMLYNAVTGERGVVRQFGENIIRSVRKGEAYNAFCAIAGHVTSYARVLLYEYVLLAGVDNTYYVDTDSLIVNTSGYENIRHLIHPTELGKLKVEGQTNYLNIRCPKDYTFGDEVKMKGIRKGSNQIGPNTWETEIWPGLNRILSREDGKYFNYYVNKTLRREITSGIVQADGWVKPFILQE